MARIFRYGVLIAALCAASTHGSAQNPELIKQAAATNGGVIIVRDALFESLLQAMTQAFNAEYKKYGLSVKVERTQSGLKRAKAEGAVFGRPATLDAEQRDAVRAGLAAGVSVSELAKRHGTSRQTIMRVRDAAVTSVRQAA